MKRLARRSTLSVTARSILVLACSVLAFSAVACGGTETDNPVTSGPGSPVTPEAPIDFEPPAEPPGCVPDLRDAPPRLPLWARNGSLLVGWDAGLVVIDASEPSLPQVLARVALDGYPRQVLLEPGAVTIAVDQWPAISDAPVGLPLSQVTRLLRFDLENPAAPVRVAEVTLEGEFWKLVPQSGGYWLMSARIDPSSRSCEVGPNGCGYVEREAIVLDRYNFSAGVLGRGERVELPYEGSVFSPSGGFATLTSGSTGMGVLHAVLFDEAGGLSPERTFEVYRSVVDDPSPIDLRADRTVILGPRVSIYDAEGQTLGAVDVEPLRPSAQSQFFERGVLLASDDERQSGAFVDFTDPAAPVLTRLDRVARALPIVEPAGAPPRRALGWYQSDAGLELSLLSLETSPPSVLDRIQTPYRVDPGARVWIDGTRGFFQAGDPSTRDVYGRDTITGAIDWAGDSLSLHAPILESSATAAFELGDHSYVIGAGVSVATFGGNVSTPIALGEDQVIDVTSGPAGEARLLARADGSRQLELERAGATERIDVSSRAARVLAARDRWIVLETESSPQCQIYGSDCDGAFLSVVGDTPARIITRVDLPDAAVPPLGSGSSVSQGWIASDDYGAGPVAISGDRWVLTREVNATCNSQVDCAVLGIDATSGNVATGVNVVTQTDCPPSAPGETSVCDQEPATPALSGSSSRRAFYVFDASLATLSEPGLVEVFGDAYFSGGLKVGLSAPEETVLSLRIEPLPREPGSPPRAQFWLDRLAVGPEGALVNAGSNPVPGYPVGLLDADTLISIQPTAASDGSAGLVRSDFATRGVIIEASRALGARFSDVVLAGGHAVYLRRAVDACEGVMTIESYRLDAELAPAGSLELGGSGDFVGAFGRDVIVSDRRQRFTRVHVADDGTLSMAAEVEASAPLYDVEWRDGTLYGLGTDGLGVDRIERLPL